MDIHDQIAVLKTMTILTDTREQDTKRARERYRSFGVSYERATLAYGDYTYQATLPNGRKIHDTSKTILPTIAIERKMNLDELAGCFTRSRDRFKREFERAAAANARIIMVVENASWENLLAGKYRSKFHPAAYLASIIAWMIRYNMSIVFCKEETSGKLIKEILYRDLKERLERGEYDS